ncbi:hypothetical protein BGZ58_004024 [Dissophora ornata]|nr:hypothetical protein BGZ58_004024 [Dissophora ornata]
MKSKTRNSKGSKKAPNGVVHGSKDSNTDGPTNVPHVSSRDQDHLGGHPPPSMMPTTTENRETPLVLAYNQVPPRNSSVAIRHVGHGVHASSSGALDGAAGGVEHDRSDRRVAPTTSMETEYIEALYSDLSGNGSLEELPPSSSSESDDIDYEDMDSYGDQGDEGDCEDFEDALGVYEHDDFLSSPEAIFLELRREQVEFEENVRQLQQQLQRQGSLLPLSTEEGADLDKHSCNLCSDPNITDAATSGDDPTVQTLPIRHMYRGTTPPPSAVLYPLPLDSPYRFGRKSSELLEPVGEFHEFQSAEGNSRQCHGPQSLHLESSTQGRLLRLIRAIQKVEKEIIAGHLKYLFPTLYEKYHGLQFGTPRLFDAVATVALAMDVSPRPHHDKAHTKHGFCWIIACGDFVGGDLCIPELGKRVVMRPGTVVAIRSTVVAYYIERYARNTSMYTMYAYTSDNNWPPAA